MGWKTVMKQQKLVEKMTIEEKAGILSGKTVWQTREIDRFSISCCAAETKENGRLIMSAEDVWNVSLTAPEVNILLCANFFCEKEGFPMCRTGNTLRKDSQLCG